MYSSGKLGARGQNCKKRQLADIGSELQRYLEDKTRGKFVAKKHGRHVMHQLAEDFRHSKKVFSKSLWMQAQWATYRLVNVRATRTQPHSL